MSWKSAYGVLESKVRFWHSRDPQAENSHKTIAQWTKGNMFAIVTAERESFTPEQKPADLIVKHLFPEIARTFLQRVHGNQLQGGFVIDKDDSDSAPEGPTGIIEAWSYALVQSFFSVQQHLKRAGQSQPQYGALCVITVGSGLYCASKGDIGECYVGNVKQFEKVSCETESEWESLPIISRTAWLSGEKELVICATNNVWEVLNAREAFMLCAQSEKPADAIIEAVRERGAEDAIVLVLEVPENVHWSKDRELFKNRKVRQKDLLFHH